jgi:hypothetical protein
MENFGQISITFEQVAKQQQQQQQQDMICHIIYKYSKESIDNTFSLSL